MMSSLLSMQDLGQSQLLDIFKVGKAIKENPAAYADCLHGKHFAMLFEKPSLRTRASFQVGIEKMGGQVHFYDMQQDKIGHRESIRDLANNLQQWYQGVVARVDSHSTLLGFKENLSIPLVNALCDEHHPCQALADFLTLYELNPEFSQWNLAYVGDSNNVSRSLMQTAAILGAKMTLVTPECGKPSASDLLFIQQHSEWLSWTSELSDVSQVNAIYTDVWVSMGKQSGTSEVAQYHPYQVNQILLDRWQAKYFMHCQPVHRGQEASSEVCDSENSLIYQQAANRMYAQQALLNLIYSEVAQ